MASRERECIPRSVGAALVWALCACGSGGSMPGPPPPRGDDVTAPAPRDACAGMAYDAYVADPRMCLTVYAADLRAPRQMAFARNGDLFVNQGDVTVLWDADDDGVSGADERATFATPAEGLLHGVSFDRDQAFVYASSQTTVYRWPYAAGLRQAEQPAQVVVRGIPSGGHSTRTLVFDDRGRLVIGVGSASNVDDTSELWSTRSLLMRYDVSALPEGGLQYMAGEVIATGMRNEVGLFHDSQGRLWGVENGRDNLSDGDLGGDIHNDNPAEEINLFDGNGPSFYGYPHCYTEFKVAGGQGAGTQWADQTLASDMQKTDAWCRDAANVRAPMFAMQAHIAPLGIWQYSGKLLPLGSDFLIAAHGSWNRRPAVGRQLLRARYSDGKIKSVEPLVAQKSADGSVLEGTWDARPVDVRQGAGGLIYFSDDSGGRIFKLGYR